MIHTVYNKLVKEGVIVPEPEREPPKIPLDFNWARKLGLIRKPASFVSTISDDRTYSITMFVLTIIIFQGGEELTYAGVPISKVFEENIGIGGVLSLVRLCFAKFISSSNPIV